MLVGRGGFRGAKIVNKHFVNKLAIPNIGALWAPCLGNLPADLLLKLAILRFGHRSSWGCPSYPFIKTRSTMTREAVCNFGEVSSPLSLNWFEFSPMELSFSLQVLGAIQKGNRPEISRKLPDALVEKTVQHPVMSLADMGFPDFTVKSGSV